MPTRELAVQVAEEIRRLAKFTGARVTSVVGGERIAAQVQQLDRDPEIVVGTPGRVIDLLDRRLLWLDNIRFIVLDEVDRMLDIGFRDDIRNILARLKQRPTSDAPYAATTSLVDEPTDGENSDDGFIDDYEGGHQTMFVSATFTEEIERLARKFMQEPVEKLVAAGSDEKPTVDNIEQFYLTTEPWDKYRALRMLLKQEQPGLTIVFTRTKHGAEHLAKNLTHDGIDCREIHGNLKQNKRDSVMKGLRGHKFEILVATDLASRGIDVQGITHIVNYDVPEDPEVYIHRIGRTARMGAEGKAYTFVIPDQGEMLTKIENLINMQIPQLNLEGFESSPPPRGRERSSVPRVAKEADAPVFKPPPVKQSMLGGKIFRKRRR